MFQRTSSFIAAEFAKKAYIRCSNVDRRNLYSNFCELLLLLKIIEISLYLLLHDTRVIRISFDGVLNCCR